MEVFKSDSKVIILPILAGLLLSASWPPNSFGPIIWVSFVPMFFFEKSTRNAKSFLFYLIWIYFGLLIWNVISFHWLYDASKINGALIIILNPILNLLPFIALRVLSLKKEHHSFFLFLLTYLSYEFLISNWQLAFPLLRLGNSLAVFPSLLQWYEYTGVSGGSLWILSVNILIYRLLDSWFATRSWRASKKALYLFMLVFLVPIIFSLIRDVTYREGRKKVEVVAIHPNIDTRSEKYHWTADELLDRYLELSGKVIASSTDFLVWPESAIANGGWMEDFAINPDFQRIRNELRGFPNCRVLSGIISYQYLGGSVEPKDRYYVKEIEGNEGNFYKTYTGAVILSPSSPPLSFRSKHKLVPFEERLPYPNVLGFAHGLIKSEGGFSFSSYNNDPIVFQDAKGVKSAYLICYESLFSDFTRRFAREGAQIFFVGLNEGYYRNTIGAKQFMYASVVRALETRRSIARSSNDGATSFISEKGRILKRFYEFTPQAIKGDLSLNRKLTFYTYTGDYVSKMAIIMMIGFFIYSIIFLKNRS